MSPGESAQPRNIQGCQVGPRLLETIEKPKGHRFNARSCQYAHWQLPSVLQCVTFQEDCCFISREGTSAQWKGIDLESCKNQQNSNIVCVVQDKSSCSMCHCCSYSYCLSFSNYFSLQKHNLKLL